jgi:hypothetical protein
MINLSDPAWLIAFIVLVVLAVFGLFNLVRWRR